MNRIFLSGAILAFIPLLNCGGSDSLSEEEARERYGCTIIDGPEGSDEYVLRCADGTSATISGGADGAEGQPGMDGTDGEDGQPGGDGEKGADGAKGDRGDKGDDGVPGSDGMDGGSCSVTDNMNGTKTISCEDGTRATVSDGAAGADGADGANGTSSLVNVTDEMAGMNCPSGGKRIEVGQDLDGDGSLSAAEVQETSYVCGGGKCQEGYSYDAGLGLCVVMTGVRYSGFVISKQGEDKFPMGYLPTLPVVTESDDPANPTPCQGTITYPVGVEPSFEQDSASFSLRRYSYGNASPYGLTLQVAGVNFARDTSNRMKTTVFMDRSVSNNPNGGLDLGTSVAVKTIAGLDSQNYIIDFGLYTNHNVLFDADYHQRTPESLQEWRDMLVGTAQVNIVIEDVVTYDYASLSCAVTAFEPLIP